MPFRLVSVHLLLILMTPAIAGAQSIRPKPYPVIPIPQFLEAVRQGTRTTTGDPGPHYWTNRARYDIDATLSPATALLRGSASATYINNSPDRLDRVFVHLRQNLHKAGAVRNRPQTLTGGVSLSEVRYEGVPLLERARSGVGYSIDGTVMEIELPEEIAPGDSASFEFSWSFEVPFKAAPRMGHDKEVFFLAYWYPQFAVYDDIHGWVAEQYMGDGEFYMDYANYDVRITVPAGWLVTATGTLQNENEVLSEQTRSRLASVDSREEIVHVVRVEDRRPGLSTAASETGALTWHYRASNVRDFAFGTSDKYVWDATLAETAEGRHARINAFYRPEEEAWTRAAEFGRFSIEYLSDFIMPYEYPHMSVVEGIIGGGMEFAMLTLIGGDRSFPALFGTTFHEIGHMWFPMMVGSNEKHYAWMDEGLTTFNTEQGRAAFWNDEPWAPGSQSYYRLAGTGLEVEPMRHTDQFPHGTSARTTATYSKPAVALHALEGVIGEDTFHEAFREYARTWASKHPYPYDFFNTIEAAAGRDLDWFWSSLFYETWTLDHAIQRVEETGQSVRVVVEDVGLVPMPVAVRVTYDDGMTAEQVISEEVWLEGERVVPLEFTPGNAVRVELDPDGYLPDLDRSNNVWVDGGVTDRSR